MNTLLQPDRVQIDNGNPDNHGEKRYLERVLLKGAGALRKINDDGPVTFFSCESDPGKIDDSFPVLKELCERLSNLNSGESLSIGTFINDAKKRTIWFWRNGADACPGACSASFR